MRTATNSLVEIEVDFSQSSAPVLYKFVDDYTNEGWQPSPWQSADVNHLNEEQILNKITEWIESQ